jgi:ring-1,2-phenylacetyl-CoA epoxidase subunit PaaD
MVTGTPRPDGRPAARASATAAPTAPESAVEAELHALAGAVPDPELPVVTLEELGVLRRVQVVGPGRAEVELTPTYTGCPAIETMSMDIRRVLEAHGVAEVTVRPVLSPPWSTDDISEEGRRKLRESGIAPPTRRASGPVPVPLGRTRTADDATDDTAEATIDGSAEATSDGTADPADATGPIPPDPSESPIPCPHCGSSDTELLSRFSSTACKALRRCLVCREPFDHFKEV